jgi:Flp pilus assembly protein TadG
MSLLLIGALGLAIDGGQMYAQRQMAQSAADAAAQAGIMSILSGTNITAPNPFGTGSSPASYTCTVADGRTPCVYARDNGFGGTTADTVILSYPATVSGVTLSSVAVPGIAVSVTRTLKTGLIRFVGAPATVTVGAKATAGITGASSKYCLIALSSSPANSASPPAIPYAFAATSGASVKATGCGIAVNSTYSVNPNNGLQIESSTVSASVIDVVAAAYSTGSTVSPTPTHIATPVADPLASLPIPPIDATCRNKTTNLIETTMYSPPVGQTLQPGTYCGGISVANSANNVTFSPGIYVINGGGLSLNRPGATANGVMFYLTGTSSTYSSIYIGNSFTGTLSAPTSGTYQGILFFGDRSIVATYGNGAQITNGVSVSMSGTLYFPTTNVGFTSGASNPNYMAIVANTMTFTSGASIKCNSDPTGQYTGLSNLSVVLVQ